MPIMQDDDGDLWEVDAAGNVIGPAKAPAPQQQGRVFTLPPNPEKVAAEERARRDQQLQEQSASITQANAARSSLEWNATHNPDGTPKPATDAKLAMIPNPAAAGIQENIKAIRAVEAALSAMDAKHGRPGSIGPTTGMLGQRFTNWNDPQGTDERAAVAAVGAQKIHDLSGAAVSASEAPRFMPFVPSVTDTPDVARQKLKRFREELVGQIKESVDFYSPANGYRPYVSPAVQDFMAAQSQQRPESELDKAGALDEQHPPGLSPANAQGGQDTSPLAGYTGEMTPEGLSIHPAEGRYQDSYLGQGMSGLNEGIADVLGGPVDLTTAAINLVPRGINAVANTDVPLLQNPALGAQWWKDILGKYGTIYGDSSDPTKQFTRRVGESVGSALFPAGAAGSLPRAGAAIASGFGGGLGAATAQQVAPGNPLAEFAGELAGSGLTGAGLFKGAERSARRDIEAAVPTVDQLKQQASELYRRAEANGATADPILTQQLADNYRQALTAEGRISPTGRLSEVYPKAKEAMQLVDDYAGQQMNPTQMQTVRKVTADALTSPDASERRLGSILTDQFDQWANPLAPELPQARDIASRYLNAEQLEKARELAGARASQFTGSGFENALRTEYRGLDRKAIQGKDRYSDILKGAIEDVSRGTPGSNAARAVGRFAVRGPVSAGLGMGVPAAIGGAIAGPPGAMAGGLGAATIGEIGRATATKMGIRNADMAELIARNGGKLPLPNVLTPEAAKLLASIAAAQQSKYLSER